MLEAFGELCKTRKDVFLIVAGSVWKDDFAPYQEIIDQYNLDATNLKTDIRFIPDDEVGYYYSACDLAVLPYLDVYQSGVIQLAYAYKKPTIATAIAPFMEIVEDGVSGYLCEANSPNSLAATIERAVGKPELFETMGQAGAKKIAQKYSWNRIGKMVSDLYLL